MRLRIHHALFAGFLAVVGVLVVLVVALAATGLRRELVNLFQDELGRELSLARALVESRPDADPDSLAGAVTARIGYRTTLIASDGTVVGDSDVRGPRLPELENHADRPEVRGASGGGLAFAERESATLGTRLLYAALPVQWRGEPSVLRVAAPLSAIDATVGRTQRAVAVAGLLAMGLALALAYFLSRAFARPLVTLAERAGLLASGDLRARAPRVTRLGELDELAQAFNGLADELQGRLDDLGRERDEMQALIDCMAEGVVALTDDARVLRTNRAARELLHLPSTPPYAPVGTVVWQPDLRDLLEDSVRRPLRAREIRLGERHLIVSSRLLDLGGAVTTFLDVTEIRRLERVRRDFVANASHELKTPLTAMRGFAETLLDDDPPDPLRRQFLESIRANTLRLQSLVDDLLDLSRLESGGWVARPRPMEVAAVAEEVWRSLAERGGGREIDFRVEGGGRARADERGLYQVFRNLFDNAVRHTPDGGEIRVRVREREEAVEVRVSDTGTGIPGRALPRIFERFYRADTARARDHGGTGLGLAIVRHLVQAMGGDVGAESELGRGTTIHFTLPSADVPAPAGSVE